MRKPRRYINRQLYYSDHKGARWGKIILEEKNNQPGYLFVSELGERIPISFHGKNRAVVKDGILEKKLK